LFQINELEGPQNNTTNQMLTPPISTPWPDLCTMNGARKASRSSFHFWSWVFLTAPWPLLPSKRLSLP